MAARQRQVGLVTAPNGTWVQTGRDAHEKWAKMSIASPRAASVLHVLVAQMGRHNALIASQSNLARSAGCSVRTLQRALDVLREGNWIEVRQIGTTGTACAYIVNDRIAWSGKRDGIRYSMFSATVVVSEDEQPEQARAVEGQPALNRIPALYPGERQLPTGDGLPPPSEPALPGLEPDLPALQEPQE